MLTIKKTVQDSSENSERVEVAVIYEYLFALRIFKNHRKILCVCVYVHAFLYLFLKSKDVFPPK